VRRGLPRPQGDTLKTVAICDTEPIAIEGLRILLETTDGLRVVAADTNLTEAMAAVREIAPDVLMLDKGLGTHLILDWLHAMAQNSVRPSTVVWGGGLTEAEALRFLQAGASGVVRKTSRLSAVLACLSEVAAGRTWMEDSIFGEAEPRPRHARSPLTHRELEVMELVERGLKNKEIGEMLGIRIGTVKIHLKHIFEKTGIRGRYGLALSGLKEKGLLAVPAGEVA
jgi:two-component system nitrate/nitrite response regulator NarL